VHQTFPWFQRRFREEGISDLYHKYWLRLHRQLLFRQLLIFIVYGLCILTLYNTVSVDDDDDDDNTQVGKGKSKDTSLYGQWKGKIIALNVYYINLDFFAIQKYISIYTL
jgi:hypothetical protein